MRGYGSLLCYSGRSLNLRSRPLTTYCLTPAQAAEVLGCAVQTLAHWRCKGNGPPYVCLGPRMVRYLVTDLDAWRNGRRVRHTTETQARELTAR